MVAGLGNRSEADAGHRRMRDAVMNWILVWAGCDSALVEGSFWCFGHMACYHGFRREDVG